MSILATEVFDQDVALFYQIFYRYLDGHAEPASRHPVKSYALEHEERAMTSRLNFVCIPASDRNEQPLAAHDLTALFRKFCRLALA